jgi:uncharacterized DUF497 family protein
VGEIEDQVMATGRAQQLKNSIYCVLDDGITIIYAREASRKS